MPKPKWVNPCGIDPRFVQHHALFYHDVTPLSDHELIQNILLSAKNALVHSDDFKEKFVSTKTIFSCSIKYTLGTVQSITFYIILKAVPTGDLPKLSIFSMLTTGGQCQVQCLHHVTLPPPTTPPLPSRCLVLIHPNYDLKIWWIF